MSFWLPIVGNDAQPSLFPAQLVADGYDAISLSSGIANRSGDGVMGFRAVLPPTSVVKGFEIFLTDAGYPKSTNAGSTGTAPAATDALGDQTPIARMAAWIAHPNPPTNVVISSARLSIIANRPLIAVRFALNAAGARITVPVGDPLLVTNSLTFRWFARILFPQAALIES